jgi:hypothetical protein
MTKYMTAAAICCQGLEVLTVVDGFRKLSRIAGTEFSPWIVLGIVNKLPSASSTASSE